MGEQFTYRCSIAVDPAASIDVVENLNSRSVGVSPGRELSAYRATYGLTR